jgi:hypothetical protein
MKRAEFNSRPSGFRPHTPLANPSGSGTKKIRGLFYVFSGYMARKLRYVPQTRTLVSITNRTIQGRYLLNPGPSFNDLFLGILGRTQRLHERAIAVYVARNQGEELSREKFVFAESVVLSPIPCWAHLPADRYRERMRNLVEEVDAEAALARKRSGARVLGVKAILAQDPLTRPTSVARSPAPLVHAATKAARKMFYAIYAEFVSAYRAAAEALRQGRRDAPFPVGSFPPAPPFVTG